ncbi:MAG TPA: hypothetical protein VMV29_05300 [Ktedonobacterales bacterium]|nr:hypothetical protein [Ktedonobacterales bacterium]
MLSPIARRWHALWRSRGVAALMATLLAALTLTALAGCGLTLHPGGDQIGFLRGGQLWVINPDGSLPRELSGSDIVGFAWSPTHHQLVFRYGAGAYALASALPPGATSAAPDADANLGISSINGGAPTQITPVTGAMQRSDGWWDAQGNRLLYREYPLTLGTPPAPVYIDSQSDQPVGIARKPLLDAAGIPTLSPDGLRAAVVDPAGDVRVGAPGQTGAVVARGALLTLPAIGGASRPARLLWQPQHNALLYATATSATAGGGVTLRLLDLGSGQSRAVLTATNLLDVAFAPDGSLLLTHTLGALSLWRLSGGASIYTIPETDPTALVWWSPDGHILLIQDVAGLTLVDAQTGAVRAQMRYATSLAEPTPTTLWRPGASSPWSGDSQQIVFVAPSNATWQGRALPAPSHSATGLYVVAASGGAPTLIDSHADTQPGWSYPDPATTFLMAS